jgi:hypothetical protein
MHRLQILLITGFLASSRLCAQSGPLRFPAPFGPEISDSLIFMSNNLIPDTADVSLAAIQFRLISEQDQRPFYLALSNAGGLVAFSDSLYRVPLRLEKRNAFPFRRPHPGRKYQLHYTCRPGAGDYFGFRVIEANKNPEILDEVFWCSPESKSALEFSSFQGWINAR